MTIETAAAVHHHEPFPQHRCSGSGSPGFAGIAAIGGLFAAVLSHGRNPDWLATGIAAGMTFAGAWVGLHGLRLLLRIGFAFTKLALLAGVLLAVGWMFGCDWAEHAIGWLWHAGGRGLDVAAERWTAWRTG